MKFFVLLILWSTLLFSCKEVSFREPQPIGVPILKELPTGLQGRYTTPDEGGDEKSDTLIVESWGYHFKDKNDKDWLGRGVLSDSLVIKYYENYYFVNFKSADQWVLRLVKQKPDGSIEFLSINIQDDAKRKEMLRKLSKKFKVKEVQKKDDTFYQINPTATQLLQLIKEGYFTGSTLKKAS
jgi:hypothetical protein